MMSSGSRDNSDVNLAAVHLGYKGRGLLTTQFDMDCTVRSRKRLESRRKVRRSVIVWDTRADSPGQRTRAHGATGFRM